VYTGGLYLVFEGQRREVAVVEDTDRGMTVADVHLAETDSPLSTSAGELTGLVTARDEILGGFLDQLDDFAQTLAFEFNKVFSSGQGLNGFQELTAEFAVDANDLALDQAGLDFTPENGSLQVLVRDMQTGLSQTTDVIVDLDGLGAGDTTLDGLAAALDAIDGLSAATTPTGILTLASESPDQEFAFANDTSGVLAALGLNTFFSGSAARDLGVNEVLIDDPAKFAASLSGIGSGTDNLGEGPDGLPRLAQFLDRPIASENGASLAVLYDRMVGNATQGSTVAQAVAEGARVFEGTLHAQKLSVSGVSLDEEAVKLMAHQHSFQASARYIGVLGELLDVLVSL
jgi:flagellar hook-associated protein 1 FlgK